MIVQPEKDRAVALPLKDLFWMFFKIGALSFGGHVTLIAIVERYLVNEKKVLTTEQVLNTMSMTSLLPGPLAVNVVGYLGYLIRGWLGFVVSFIAILLPATLLMIVLSILYYRYQLLFDFAFGINILLVAVGALIFSTGINLFQKQIKTDQIGIILCLLTVGINFWYKGLLGNILLMFLGGTVGYFLVKRKTGMAESVRHRVFVFPNRYILGVFVVELILLIAYLLGAYHWVDNLLVQLFTVISGMSLTLFGGGFVIIPYMKSLLVDQLGWITNKEMVYAVTLGQITPGPILVNMTFVGYKMAGIVGAIVATVSIFLPSALLTVGAITSLKQTEAVKSILEGIRPVVIGLIFSAGFQLIFTVSNLHWFIILYGIIVFIALFKFNINATYVLTFSLALALMTYFFM